MQTESELDSKYAFDGSLNQIKLKDSVINSLAEKSKQTFAQRMKETQQLAQEAPVSANGAAANKTNRVLNATASTGKRVLHIVPHSHVDDISQNKEVQMQLKEQALSASAGDGGASGPADGFVGSVADILNSTVAELEQNPNRTFAFGDIKYFKGWYDELDTKQRDQVKKLVKEGQLDLVNGGWTPPDEALTQYDALLDNFMVGQQFLVKEFDLQPIVSWQLDVNGVSQGYARLARDVGFDVLIFSSVATEEKQAMRKGKQHTQVWRTGEQNFGRRKDVLAVTLDQQRNSSLGSYCWPEGFWADTNYLVDVPMVLDKTASDYKFEQLVRSFYEEVTQQFDQGRSNHVFKPFGCDMAYVDAKLNYRIMD